MALITKDRVKESTTTTSTGAYALGGADATFDTFTSCMSNGDTTYYAVAHTTPSTDEWEVGIGTWNTGNTLTRTTVLAGSNGTSAVNFSAGTKNIFMTVPAEQTRLGITATVAELNFTDGVTSNIQTQLDAKQPYHTIAVTVVNSGGNKYALDGTVQQTALLPKSVTIRFDQSDSSNAGHPLRLSTTSDGTHASGSAFSTGVSAVGTPGSAGAYTQVTLEQDAPDLLYTYCTAHSGMGAKVYSGKDLSTLTSTVAELNILDGVTSTAAELNILDGVTSTAAELNILDGVTSTAAELNILDGVTATATELNIMDGVTATTTELNYVDGVTSSIQTQLDAKLGSTSPITISTTGNETQLTLTSTDADHTTGPNMTFYRNSASPADNDQTGSMFFIGKDDGGDDATYGAITTHIVDASAGTEDGKLSLESLKAGTLTATLSVASGSILTPSAGTGNVHLGENAGNSIASGGNYNVTVGDEAGTALTTGDNNVAVGYAALYTEDGHGKNVAVGKNALYTLNAGADGNNTAVGFEAGVMLSTGTDNVIIGAEAGDALTTGSLNTVIGKKALGADTAGSRSIAIGRFALGTQNFTSATDSYNVAIGYSAGGLTTTGQYNTIMGGGAYDANSTGSYTVAIGYQALSASTSVSGNTAVGYLAGEAITTGYGNTFLGYKAGMTGTTPANNTFLGYECGMTTTDDNAYNNTAVGHRALKDLTLQNSCTAVGQGAGKSLTTGAGRNTVVGGSALYNATTSYDTTCVGYAAGNDITTGYYNTLVGSYTGQYVTTGRHNVAIGDDALSTTTTGKYNIAIGRYAGYGMTTADYNCLIGYLNGYAGGQSNQLTGGGNTLISGGYTNVAAAADTGSVVIGFNITGRGSNTALIGGSSHAYNQPNVSYWSVYSDRRLKKNIKDSTIGLDAIKAVKIRSYEYKTKAEKDEVIADGLKETAIIETPGPQVGVIAQELQAVMPDCVSTNSSTGVLTVNPENLQWAMVKAVQELSAKNDALEARIKTLEG